MSADDRLHKGAVTGRGTVPGTAPAPAHPVQGEARAEQTRDTYPIASAREVASASLRGQQRRDFLAGWDAHTAHAAAEVEQLKAHLSAAHDLIDFIRDEHVIDWREKLTTSGADEALGLLSAFDTISDARRLTEHGAEGTG